MGNKSFLWRRIAATIIDLCNIYCISFLIKISIQLYKTVDITLIFTIAFFAYYIVSYLLTGGCTPGRALCRLRVEGNEKNTISAAGIITREISKATIFLALPFFVLPNATSIWSVMYLVMVMFVIMAGSLVFLLLQKQAWWETLSRSRSVKSIRARSATENRLLFCLAACTVVTIVILIEPLFTFNENRWHTTFVHQPRENQAISTYADFVKANGSEPVDYIFNLFRKYDVVVISERLHPEYTQYEFIKSVIEDKRFNDQVGNIFTECGSVSFQDTLDTYLDTRFQNKDSLDRATANLQRNSNGTWPLWDNTNLFDLLEFVNSKNASLADSAKTHWYFTQPPVDWRTMSHEKFVAAYTNISYDSLMAATVIENYRAFSGHRRHKALVIMNSRHGYGLIDPKLSFRMSREYYGTTACLMKNLPGKVANVYVNTASIRFATLFTPVQGGNWDAAFQLLGNRDAAFDFAGSPFGEDCFDAAFFYTPRVRYKDVFTGMIFHRPYNEQLIEYGFPYEFEKFEDSITRRASYVSASFANEYRQRIADYKERGAPLTTTGPWGVAVLYNMVNAMLTPLILLIVNLTGLILFFSTRRLESIGQ